MSSVYYDIFLNPEPMDVELSQYDTEGNINTVTIPNRAKDRRIAIEYAGSPEGNVTANPGACCIDTVNSAVYFKVSGIGNTGWTTVLTQSNLNTSIQSYLTGNNYATQSYVSSYVGSQGFATSASVAASINGALEVYRPTISMIEVASGTGNVSLVDNTGYYITASGNITFNLPTVSDLKSLHKIFIQLKKTTQTITLAQSGVTVRYFNNLAPDLSASGLYNIVYEYDNTMGVGTGGWVVGTMYKGTVS